MAERNDILLTMIGCGQTAWEADGRVHGATDLPLCPAGRASISAIASALKPKSLGAIYHSSDEASTDTAHIIAEAVGSKTKLIEELSEPDLGLIDGLTEKDFAERFPRRHKQWLEDPLSLSPPEGEPLVDGRARIFEACSKILKRSKSDHPVIVLRPLALGFMRCWLCDRSVTSLWDIVKARPQIERYALNSEIVSWLEEAAATAQKVNS